MPEAGRKYTRGKLLWKNESRTFYRKNSQKCQKIPKKTKKKKPNNTKRIPNNTKKYQKKTEKYLHSPPPKKKIPINPKKSLQFLKNTEWRSPSKAVFPLKITFGFIDCLVLQPVMMSIVWFYASTRYLIHRNKTKIPHFAAIMSTTQNLQFRTCNVIKSTRRVRITVSNSSTNQIITK